MWILLLALGCGLKTLLPEGPVIDPWERSLAFPSAPAEVTYTEDPLVTSPVLPMMVFGLTYDLDLVIVSEHPEWNMHEYARVRTPEGPLWLMKDAREASLSQSIVADLEDIETFMPEVPIARKSYPVQVHDRSTDRLLDLELFYENIDGEPVHVTYQGRPPTDAQKLRNGSTMGHSRNELIAVLDLSHRTFARRSRMEIGGASYKPKRLLGLLPFRTALVQTQGGIPIGQYVQQGLKTTHRTFSGNTVPLQWREEPLVDGVALIQEQPLRTLRYHFRQAGESLELQQLSAHQWGYGSPTVVVQFSPALPDLRRPFEGRARARFVIDVNGQTNHAIGVVEATWADGEAILEITPEEPWWVADRPMRASVRVDGETETVTVDVARR